MKAATKTTNQSFPSKVDGFYFSFLSFKVAGFLINSFASILGSCLLKSTDFTKHLSFFGYFVVCPIGV
ncbi:hypothetical protein L2E82_08052 [Cichorium intybus]|uniref:Uncharacterized protein n=1 Tax=Cichorium intybus TaxID=13427 RepID=A0ACB9G5I0_CICIN|nr:hypothetical protein L2E82_08052 [Cichorium intybus]